MSGEKRLILVVDDSAVERHQLVSLLKREGYSVEAARDAEEAIEMAIRLHPAAIVMDVLMPGMNGFQATRALGRDPATKDIPVLLCTSKDGESDRVWGLRQGAADYLTKPVNPEELLQKLVQVL